MKIRLNQTMVGEGSPVYVIAEMSANHGGDLQRAKDIIYAAKEAGADCVKIQTYTADTITLDCDNPYFKITSGPWQKENTLHQLYSLAYTPWEWHEELFAEAKKVGIDMFSTPFDNSAVDYLEKLDVPFYKIASPELVDVPLIEYVASKHKPIIMSTGMGTEEEIWDAVNAIRNQGNEDIILLRCAVSYPAVTDEMKLMTMKDMGERFGVLYGLSDHSFGSVGPVVATALGASVIEKHFCLSRKIQTPDSAFSMEKEEFAEMVKAIRQAERAVGEVKYGPTSQEEGNVKYRKSLFASAPIKKGEAFTWDNVKSVRPAAGVKPKFYPEFIGKKASVDVAFGTPLTFDMIEKKS